MIYIGESRNGMSNKVENGLQLIWDLTVASFSFREKTNVEFRLQRNVVNFNKKQS